MLDRDGTKAGEPVTAESTRAAAATLRRSIAAGAASPATIAAALAEIPPDERDAWLDVIWDSGELLPDEPLPAGCVPYLPCPVATVIEAVARAEITRDDVFVDIGAGLGRVAALVHMLTGAPAIGLEIQPGLVQAALARADWLDLDRVRFLQGDAPDLVGRVMTGSVFFLYCPFSGERLDRVLDALEEIAYTRPIRVCGVDTPALQRPWLVPIGSDAVELAIYRSKLHTLQPAQSAKNASNARISACSRSGAASLMGRR